MLSIRSFLALSFVSICASPAAARPSTWFVDANATPPGLGTEDSPYVLIQDALSSPNTADGDTILVRPGTYQELVDFLGKDVSLVSTEGPAQTVIDVSTVFSLEQSAVKFRSGEGPSCLLRGFTLRGGAGTQVLEPFFGNLQFAGGAILSIGSAPTIRDCVLTNNDCEIGGGLYGEQSQLVLEDCTVENNQTLSYGAGLQLYESEILLRDVVIRKNSALAGNGGGINAFGGELTLEDCTLDGNTAFNGGEGGNIFIGNGALLQMTRVNLKSGFTLDGNGAGLSIRDSTAVIDRCRFVRNSSGDALSNREGGALFAAASQLSIQRSSFLTNASSRGGALALSGTTAKIRDSLFDGNVAESGLTFFFTQGGAVSACQSQVTITDCVFRDNQAVNSGPGPFGEIAQGGALWCDTPAVEVENCLFQGNQAFYNSPPDPSLSKQEPGSQGGALCGPARVNQTLFLGNRAWSNPGVFIGRAEGGAVFGAFMVRDCAFFANQVDGVGPVPDRGPAAESATLTCPTLEGNLPATLPPLGPDTTVLPCPDGDAGTDEPAVPNPPVRAVPSEEPARSAR